MPPATLHHNYRNPPIVPKVLMRVRETGIDSSDETVVDPGWNCTTPCGLSLACTVRVAVVATESRVADPVLLLTAVAPTSSSVNNSATSGS